MKYARKWQPKAVTLPAKAKSSRAKTLFISLLILAACTAIGLYFRAHPAPKFWHPADDEELVAHIMAETVKEDISAIYRPALIYYNDERTGTKFRCVGNVFMDQEQVLYIATADHVFKGILPMKQIYSVRLIRGPAEQPLMYFEKIVQRGDEISLGSDMVVVKLSLTPVDFKASSAFQVLGEEQSFYGTPKQNSGHPVSRLKSLLSGQYVDVVGATQAQYGAKGVFLLIDKHAVEGLSGTGYLDDLGGLHVLHAGSSDSDEADMIKRGSEVTGKKITGMSSVSGPLMRTAN